MDYACFKTDLGPLLIAADDKGVCEIKFKSRKVAPTKNPHLAQASQELKEYFSGKRTKFNFKLNPAGTDFQKKVWKALQRVPYGKTTSYSEIAQRINKAKAVRAVGGANNKNPLPIVVPCHRIIGKSGKLVGYNGGLKKKKWLLQHEASA